MYDASTDVVLKENVTSADVKECEEDSGNHLKLM